MKCFKHKSVDFPYFLFSPTSRITTFVLFSCSPAYYWHSVFPLSQTDMSLSFLPAHYYIQCYPAGSGFCLPAVALCQPELLCPFWPGSFLLLSASSIDKPAWASMLWKHAMVIIKCLGTHWRTAVWTVRWKK